MGLNTVIDKEIGEFHIRYRPFVRPVFRGALILTASRRSAKKLQVEIYQKAFLEYLQAGHIIDFKGWLTDIVDECFSDCMKKKLTKNQSSIKHMFAVDYLEALTKSVDGNRASDFRSWLKKIIYTSFRKPTMAD